MKIKIIANFVLLLALIIASASCSKKTIEQSNKNIKDTIKSVQKNPFDVKNASKETLPQNIKDYVASNYKDYTITNATYDALCKGGDAVDVSIENKNRNVLSLIFKPDGSYIQKEEDVPFNTAPQKVKEVIKTKYSGYKAGDQIEKLTLADNSTQYLVDIEKDKVSKEVILTPDGQLVCEN